MTVRTFRGRVSITRVGCLACGWEKDPNLKRSTLLRAAKKHAGECTLRGRVVVDSEHTTAYQRSEK